MRKLRTFLGLPRGEQWIVMQSFLLLPLVTLLLGTIGLARCWALLQFPLSASRRGGQGVRPVAATVRMVDVASRNLPWQLTCLPRSLVLWFVLRRRGVPAELRIGVRKSGQQLKAHAWVEVDHQVLNDTPDIAAEYRPFEDIAAALRTAPSGY